jgi:ornithine cyclodeaminase/alanine dehydrogenase-like protein (mu-crystallin family)
MAKPGARRLCVIGTGEQAETQVLTIAPLIQSERIVATSRNAANREAFQTRLAKAGVTVDLTDDPESTVRESDVISLATTSRDPVIKASWVQRGAHINAVGANLANRREVDVDLIRMSRVVVEYREQALQEAGDLVIPLRVGEIREAAIAAELGEVVTGAKPGRTAESEITLFKSIGVAIEDVSVAAFAYERAIVQGVGAVVEM